MCGTGEALVAAAARTAARDYRSLAGPHEVVPGPVLLNQHLRARRHAELERLAVGAVLERALAVAAAPCFEVRAAPIALEIAQRVVTNEHDVAAATTVAAVRTALGDVRFAAEAEAPVAPAARADEDSRSILHAVKHGGPRFPDHRRLERDRRRDRQASRRGRIQARARGALGRPPARARERVGGEERALALECDVAEWDQQRAMVERTLERFGGLDVAFANAGFGAKRGFLQETPEHWRSMVLTNVYGAALTIRATLPHLREAKGHLLLTGSVAGRRALPGSLYSSTKWAVTGMGESVRQELNGTGARVTVIEPGMVDTPFFDSGAAPGALTADDVARTVMFAVSQPPHVDVNEILVRPTAQDN